MTKQQLISIILGTYNEKENLANLVPRIENTLKKNNLKGEIVVVDDTSPDGTWKVARQLNRKYHNIRLLLRPRKMGPGSAHADGYRFSRGDIVVGMDVDSHAPEDIVRFVKKINEGYDLVISSRFIKGGKYEVKSFKLVNVPSSPLLAPAPRALNPTEFIAPVFGEFQ